MNGMKVTIGITAYNEEKNIGKLLESLIKERYSFKLKEIIVVASGCTDKTTDIIERFSRINKKIKLIIEKKRRGKASAINIILKRSKGSIIVFICADNIPKKDSINKIVKKFSKKKIGAVSGRPFPLESKNTFFGYISNLIWDLHHKACLKKPKISGELFAIRNEIVKKIPYNIINDDGYLTFLVKKLNYKLIYEPRAITYMTGKNTFFSLVKRRRRIARGYMQLKEIGMDVNIPLNIKIESVIKYIKKEPHNIYKILFAIILEIIIDALAYYDTIVGKTPYCWEKV